MPLLILLAFIAIPVAEIALFIQVGGWIGTAWTLTLIVVTAAVGVGLLKRQGLATWQLAQTELRQGVMPMRQVFDGACLLVAGAFLLTPGFFTDALGFGLLIPALRSVLLAGLSNLAGGQTTIIIQNHDPFSPQTHARHKYDVEGEFSEIESDKPQDR